jgi:hypothetical protein
VSGSFSYELDHELGREKSNLFIDYALTVYLRGIRAMMLAESSNILQYSPFNSSVDPSFWHKLSQVKLDIDKLEEKVRSVWGYYSNAIPPGLTSFLHVDCSAYNT